MMTREEHLLVRAMEECAELTQRLSKALIFGIDQSQPLHLSNRERVLQEYTDLIAVMDLVGFTTSMVFDAEIRRKQAKVEGYLQLSKELGTLRETT